MTLSPPISAPVALAAQQLQEFARNGFLIIRQLATMQFVEQARTVVAEEMYRRSKPLELESDLGYPGAPSNIAQPGGDTIRRLLDAYGRHDLFREWATNPSIKNIMKQLLADRVVLSRSHHNCIMSKLPVYSSETGWHQDIRHWSFESPDLISTWLALGPETPANGALSFLPGSHVPKIFEPRCLDAAKFLRGDLSENIEFIAKQKTPILQAGDVVFFHARLFHSAGKNLTNIPKYSLAFAYHGARNRAITGTNSARYASIEL